MLDLAVSGMMRGVARPVVAVRVGVVVVLVEVERVGRRGGVWRVQLGEEDGVEMLDMNCVGMRRVWRLSCGSVYTLSPLRISIPISLSPAPGMGSPRRGIRVHGSRLEYLCYEQVVDDERWRGTIDGLATVLFASRGVHEHGHGR